MVAKQKIGAHLLETNLIKVSIRVKSEESPADAPSRIFCAAT